ncbi:hypothetical protein Y1Q_0006593 [Alligator mississippiensis]|uniref:Uncharacterized protein n=1 Tax=Alligator mississippiensis TaxID=8496 RepID=A0A151NTS8_ALLMI|nr:hypothetical protein Y1Q_0006593 [Alligator mississippiensis]
MECRPDMASLVYMVQGWGEIEFPTDVAGLGPTQWQAGQNCKALADYLLKPEDQEPSLGNKLVPIHSEFS